MPYDRDKHGPDRVVGPGFHAEVFALVRTIPRGRVATYGDIATALGHPGVARQVGFALAACPDDIPWHRVVNARGELSARADGRPSATQLRLLRAESIVVDARGRITQFDRLRYAALRSRAH